MFISDISVLFKTNVWNTTLLVWRYKNISFSPKKNCRKQISKWTKNNNKFKKIRGKSGHAQNILPWRHCRGNRKKVREQMFRKKSPGNPNFRLRIGAPEGTPSGSRELRSLRVTFPVKTPEKREGNSNFRLRMRAPKGIPFGVTWLTSFPVTFGSSSSLLRKC